jgi:hypothetical protein
MQDQKEFKLLFRNKKSGRIECNMFSKTDMPIYVQIITEGKEKFYCTDLVDNTLIQIHNTKLKYAPIVNNLFQIIAYYNNDFERVEPNTPLNYIAMYDL